MKNLIQNQNSEENLLEEEQEIFKMKKSIFKEGNDFS